MKSTHQTKATFSFVMTELQLLFFLIASIYDCYNIDANYKVSISQALNYSCGI